MKDAIKKWWEGEFVTYHGNGAVVFVNSGSVKRHWTARLVRWAVEFYLREWKWVIGAVATLIGALVFKKF